MKNTVQNVKNTKKYCHTGEPGKKIISEGIKSQWKNLYLQIVTKRKGTTNYAHNLPA